jgi:hypothetical protein
MSIAFLPDALIVGPPGSFTCPPAGPHALAFVGPASGGPADGQARTR